MFDAGCVERQAGRPPYPNTASPHLTLRFISRPSSRSSSATHRAEEMRIATRALPGVAVRASKSSPAMPDPDPQPPKPRAVSPARWLLMLLPSVPIFLAPFVADAVMRFRTHRNGEDAIGMAILMLLFAFIISTVLSFILGFRLEKWRRGTTRSKSEAILASVLVLFTNCLIAFAGCAVGASLSK